MTVRRIPGIVLTTFILSHLAAGGEPVALRAENLVVNPSTGPVCYVTVKNLLARQWEGVLKVKFPEGWKVDATQKEVSVEAGRTERVPFSIEEATDLAANVYPFELTAEGTGGKVTRSQHVVCASAPYLKAEVDGETSEWKNSIPIAFDTKGKKTVVRTHWTKRYFYILVEVEEDEFTASDAVQFAFAPRGAKDAGDKSARWEYLATADGEGEGVCRVLLSPGDAMEIVKEARQPGNLPEAGKSAVAVKRNGRVTCWEISVSLRSMRPLRPTPGREFCFSVIVHDPGGTGLRDTGSAVGLPRSRRNHGAWCKWQGAKWPEKPPFDGKIEWGFCSSIH